MPFTDWVTDGLYWWGEQLWIFMRNLPPYDWIEFPLYYVKAFSYLFPILIIILLPYILWFRTLRKNRKLKHQVASFSRGSYTHGFSCPHCSFIPSFLPIGETYHCAKCGKFSKLKSKTRSPISLHI